MGSFIQCTCGLQKFFWNGTALATRIDISLSGLQWHIQQSRRVWIKLRNAWGERWRVRASPGHRFRSAWCLQSADGNWNRQLTVYVEVELGSPGCRTVVSAWFWPTLVCYDRVTLGTRQTTHMPKASIAVAMRSNSDNATNQEAKLVSETSFNSCWFSSDQHNGWILLCRCRHPRLHTHMYKDFSLPSAKTTACHSYCTDATRNVHRCHLQSALSYNNTVGMG